MWEPFSKKICRMRNDPKVMVSLKLFVISFVHSQGRTESLRAERKGNRCGSDTCNRRKYKSPSSGNISSATGSQQGVSKWQRGVCGMGTWEWRESQHTASFIAASGGISLRDSQPVVTFHYNCSAFSFSMVRLHLLSWKRMRSRETLKGQRGVGRRQGVLNYTVNNLLPREKRGP